MKSPRRLVLLTPVCLFLVAAEGQKCGEDPNSTPSPGDITRCATSGSIDVEQGGAEKALANLCLVGVNTITRWYTSKLGVEVLTIDDQLTFNVAGDRFLVGAPAGTAVGTYDLTLKVTHLDSAGSCGGFDCVDEIAWVVNVKAQLPLSVAIEPTTESGSPFFADVVREGEKLRLTAIIAGVPAGQTADLVWRGVDIFDGRADANVDQQASEQVTTTAFETRERAYSVTLTSGGASVVARIRLRGAAPISVAQPNELTRITDRSEVSSYPGSPFTIAFEVDPMFAGKTRLYHLDGSDTLSAAERDALAVDLVAQATGRWTACDGETTIAMSSSPSFEGDISACAIGATTQSTGVFRSVFDGTINSRPTVFGTAFARGY